MSQKRITGYTAERIQKIEDELVSGGGLDRDGNLILNLKNGRTLNLGKVGAVDKGGDVDLSKVRPPEELSYIQDPVKDPLFFAPIYYSNEPSMPPSLRLVLREDRDGTPDAKVVDTYENAYEFWTEEEQEKGGFYEEEENYQQSLGYAFDGNPKQYLWTATIIGCTKAEGATTGWYMSDKNLLVTAEATSGVCSFSWIERGGYGPPSIRVYNPTENIVIRAVRQTIYPVYGGWDILKDGEIAAKWLGL